MSRPPHRPVIAFTLIELLVVIGLIAILAAVLLPHAEPAPGKSKTPLYCLNNLKQWGLATQLFAAENDDLLPKDGSPNGTAIDEGWYNDLPNVIGLRTYKEMPWRANANVDPGRSISICPSNTRRSNGNNLFHYCLNEHVNGIGAGNQTKLSSIPRPVLTVWLFDNGKLAAVAQQNNVHSNLHNQGAHFTFLDGHAHRFRNTEYWNFFTNEGITNNPNLIWIP